jgi:hypothetical protein
MRMASNDDGRIAVVGRSSIFWGLVLIACLLFAHGTWAFVRTTFPSGAAVFWQDAQAVLNLRLGCPPTPLTNWGPCWDDAAEDAAGHWNAVAARFRFFKRIPSVAADPCNPADGVNTVVFSNTLCGLAFPPGVLAVTLVTGMNTGAISETAVLFNDSVNWSTYPGPLRPGVVDFHRVAIHEFGHVVGLAHPDEHGQNVVAIMNSTVSDIDSLQADDVVGVNAIYPSTVGPPGVLENPRQGGVVSGISTISGWVCNANQVELRIDGFSVLAAYGTSREDTRSVCGDANNGFGLLFNWNLLGDGPRTIVAHVDGVEFARATFTVATLGQEFLTGASGTFLIPNFAGRNVIIQWQESLQNFGIIGTQ